MTATDYSIVVGEKREPAQQNIQGGINPWIGMFIKPKETLRWISDNIPEKYYLQLVFLYSLSFVPSRALDFSHETNQIFKYEIPFILFMSLVSFIICWIVMSLSSLVFMYIGKWLGGKGTFRQCTLAILWGSYPLAILEIVRCIFIITTIKGFGEIGVLPLLTASLLGLTYLIFINIYSIYMYTCCISVTQEFSLKKSLVIALFSIMPGWILTIYSIVNNILQNL